MVTIFSPLMQMTPDEFRRVTEVTYLGFVHGTMAALRNMQPRNHGTIIQVGSALAYRGIPLQSAYCGAKHAIRGFTDSVRCELIHARSRVALTMVELPAVNTPQFDWARIHLRRKPRPVPPVVEPEAIAAAIFHAACRPRREYWRCVATTSPTVVARGATGWSAMSPTYPVTPCLTGAKQRQGAAVKRTDSTTAGHGDMLDLIARSEGLDRLRDVPEEARSLLSLSRPEQTWSVHAPAPATSGSPESARRLFAVAQPISGQSRIRAIAVAATARARIVLVAPPDTGGTSLPASLFG